MLAQWRMLSIREVPAAAISRESLSVLLHTPIFKCLKTTYYEPKLGKPGFCPRVKNFFWSHQANVQNAEQGFLSFQAWTVEGSRKAIILSMYMVWLDSLWELLGSWCTGSESLFCVAFSSSWSIFSCDTLAFIRHIENHIFHCAKQWL